MNPGLAVAVAALLAGPAPEAPAARDPECVHDCWTQYHTCMDACWDVLHDNVSCDQEYCNPPREACDKQCPVTDPQVRPDQQHS